MDKIILKNMLFHGFHGTNGFEKEYVYGQVFKLFPRQKGHKALASLVSVEGSSYYK